MIIACLVVACEAVPGTGPATPPEAATGRNGAATVTGALPRAGVWRTQAVSLRSVVIVQAEVGGPGISSPLTAQAALEPDNRFAVPFAAVPFGENRPVTVTGYGIDGRPVPGVVLHGWLTVNADGFRGQASAAATPIGTTLQALWRQAGTDAVAGLIAREIVPDDLQAYLNTLSADSTQDYSLMDGERLAAALLRENRHRSAFDITSNGVRMPIANAGVIRRPGRVRGTLYGLQADESLQGLTVDDPLSPGIAPLPTVSGTAFLFYPVVPGGRQLTALYGQTGTTTPPRQTYRLSFMASDDGDTPLDLHLPMARPRQIPPGGTLTISGVGFGLQAGSANLGLGTSGVGLSISRWTNGEVALTLPNPVPSGPQPLRVAGTDWQWQVQPLQVLAGAPRLDTATVTAAGGVRELHLTGANFSAHGADHVVTLTGSDNVAVPVPVVRNGETLDGTIPSRVTGSALVRMSIGGVNAAATPAVTVSP